MGKVWGKERAREGRGGERVGGGGWGRVGEGGGGSGRGREWEG